jgi:hypothetical protein
MITIPAAAAVFANGRGHSLQSGNHVWHIVEGLAFLVTSLGGIAFAEHLQGRKRDGNERTAIASSARRGATLLPLVALAGAAAASIHFVVMPEHFEEATLYGLFFAITASTQLIYSAWLLLRPSRALLAIGAVGNITIVVLWLVTRLVAVPLGPGAGTTEEFGGLDILATVFELTMAVGAITLIRRPLPMRRALHPVTWSPAIWTLAPLAAFAIGVTAFIAPPS